MADVPNPADAPKAAAKGAKGLASTLKGRKPATYAAVIVGVLVLAYYIRKREAAATDAADYPITGPDSSSTPVGGSTTNGYDNSYFPGATQGAYYGYPTPQTGDPQDAPQNPWQDVSGFLFDLLQSGVVTGGGPPTVDSGTHDAPIPQPAPVGPPVAVASKPQPVSGGGGVTIAGHTWPNGKSSTYIGSGTNKYGKYGRHKITFKDGHKEEWWHYVSGSANGKWTGPH